MSINLLVDKCWHGSKHFDVHLQRIRSIQVLLKGGKDASYDEGNGWKRCLLPARVGIFSLMFNHQNTSSFCTST